MKVFAPQNTAVVRLLVMAWLAMAGTGPAEDQPAGINAGGRRILAGDRLNISVREQPDMSRVYAVAGDGSIDFGFAGRVVIAELTSDEAARKLESVLEERYFKEANVTISIANFVEGDVLISGAVADPGTLEFRGDSILTLMEAMEANWSLPTDFALMPVQSGHPEVWTDVARMLGAWTTAADSINADDLNRLLAPPPEEETKRGKKAAKQAAAAEAETEGA